MGFQDVAFLPSPASFPPLYLKSSVRGESLGTATCYKTVVGGKQGYTPSKILLLLQSHVCVVVFNGNHKTVTKMR